MRRRRKATGRRSDGLNPNQRLYLKAVRDVYPGDSWAALDLVEVEAPDGSVGKLKKKTVEAWRYRNKVFRVRMDRLLEELDALAVKDARRRTTEAVRGDASAPTPAWPALTDEEAVYVQVLRETAEEPAAWKASGLTLAQVEEHAAANPRFAAAIAEIEREWAIALAAVLRRKGLDGNVAAAEKAVKRFEGKPPPPRDPEEKEAEYATKARNLIHQILLRDADREKPN